MVWREQRRSYRAFERTPVDPLSLVMFGLIAVLIFFMFRNGKKRQQAQREMQDNVRPGAQVMLQSGIFATIESVDDEENRVTVRSGESTLVVHRNAIGQIVTPAETAPETTDLAPDDDPEFGERVSEHKGESTDAAESDAADAATEAAEHSVEESKTDEGDTPKA